ncbi:hypothetical protein FHT40_006305 [Mycolicibacterium sp. BK556]|uniref:hypothetical protein n=1 Tax=unclassified Mycolicibacterium TaxID=2636767 RepID=UPI00160F168E|nr:MULTISPECIES: hypothetical protein [unclassified Mycolicibacterium]MBB3606614.1 hypothetical protein [Mycolicibacterium sp. BK556]MBB3636139.1 hypothetical protein [Mycolicibacterium sp. BK607]
MAAHIIPDAGYKDVVLTHPLGGPDHGADATCTINGQSAIMAAWFPLGPKTFTAGKNKLEADLKAALAGGRDFSRMAFVTNQKLTEGQRKKLVALGGEVEIDLFDLERCTHILDLPRMEQTKERYLDIPAGKPPLLVAVDVDGAARFFEDGDELLERLLNVERGRVERSAEKLRSKPIDPIGYKSVLPMMQTWDTRIYPTSRPSLRPQKRLRSTWRAAGASLRAAGRSAWTTLRPCHSQSFISESRTAPDHFSITSR